MLPPAPTGPRAGALRGKGLRPRSPPPRATPHLKQLPREAKLGPKRQDGQSQSPSRRPRRPAAASPPPLRPPPPPPQVPTPVCLFCCCPFPRPPPLPPPPLVAPSAPPPSAPPLWPLRRISCRICPKSSASPPAPPPRDCARRCGMGPRLQAGRLCAEWWLCSRARASATRSRALACPRARRARRCQAGSPRGLVARAIERKLAPHSRGRVAAGMRTQWSRRRARPPHGRWKLCTRGCSGATPLPHPQKCTRASTPKETRPRTDPSP